MLKSDPLRHIPGQGTMPLLKNLCTIRVGGEAKDLRITHDEKELKTLLHSMWQNNEDFFVLAGGSNTIFNDNGIEKPIILIRTHGVEVTEIIKSDNPNETSKARIKVQAGHSWDALVKFSVDNDFAGIEALSGIPGSAGAAPIQNIGAYGQEISEVLHSVEVFDLHDGNVKTLLAKDLDLSYRSSIFKTGYAAVVLNITIDLEIRHGHPALSKEINFDQLAKALDVEIGSQVTLVELRKKVLEVRRSKGMILDLDDNDSWSAGSFFINPVVNEEIALSLPNSAPKWQINTSDEVNKVVPLTEITPEKYDELNESLPLNKKLFKLSAAWLIENSGIHKGFSLPGSQASISNKHTLSITNRGAASATQIAELARYVQLRVASEYGIALQPEVKLVGIELI